jgi:hypothetical protein
MNALMHRYILRARQAQSLSQYKQVRSDLIAELKRSSIKRKAAHLERFDNETREHGLELKQEASREVGKVNWDKIAAAERVWAITEEDILEAYRREHGESSDAPDPAAKRAERRAREAAFGSDPNAVGSMG